MPAMCSILRLIRHSFYHACNRILAQYMLWSDVCDWPVLCHSAEHII